MQVTKLSWLLRSITASCVKLLRFTLQSGRTLVETCNSFQESSPTSRQDLYYSRLPLRASFMLCWKSGSSGLLGTTEEVRTMLHLRPCSLRWVSLDLEQLRLSYAFLVQLSSEINSEVTFYDNLFDESTMTHDCSIILLHNNYCMFLLSYPSENHAYTVQQYTVMSQIQLHAFSYL